MQHKPNEKSMKKVLTVVLGLIMSAGIFAQHSIENPFFDQVTYRGAFDAITLWTDGWTNWDAENTTYPATTVTKSGEITSNETWTASDVYKIEGFLYVRSGATLTIEAGTVIRGDKASKGTLIVERGAKLNAVGTYANPIVFTSNEAAGSRDYGDWGGIVLCGKAAINVPGGEAQIEGGPTSYYGGGTSPDNADNSGTLSYIRIEFPGIPFVTDKEINGLTLGGVGSATTIDHIQIYRCGDDAFEWFGGTVNAKYLVSSFTWDDDFDTDYGFSGMIQYAVALRDSSIADPGSGSNGFESDNDGSGSANTPVTNPIFSNISMFGPKVLSTTSINTNYKRAMHLRRNSQIDIYNSFFAGYKDGLFVDGSAARQNLAEGELSLFGVTLAYCSGNYFPEDTVNVVRDYYLTSWRMNDTLTDHALLQIADPFNYGNPDFRPVTGSPALNGSVFSGIIDRESNNVDELIIYPNPATNVLNVAFSLRDDETVVVEIMDMSGRICSRVVESREMGSNVVGIDVHQLETGVYSVRIKAGSSIATMRFFK